MKKLLLSGVAILAISSAALAADPVVYVEEVVAPAPTSVWDGLYVGAIGGYGWAQGGLNVDSYSNHSMNLDFYDDQVQFSDFLSDSGSSWASDDGDGWFGGGVIGYNIQSGNFVFGVEADISFSDIDIGKQSTSSSAAVGFSGFLRDRPRREAENGDKDVLTVYPIDGSTVSTTTASASVDWFGTANVRAGYAINNVLLFASGGLAYGQVKLDGTVDSTHSFGNGDMSYQSAGFGSSSTKTGWNIGGGVDVAVTPNFVVGAFYRYVDLGSVSGGASNSDYRGYLAVEPGCGQSCDAWVDENGYGSGGASADANFHTVGVRAVYKFDTGSLFN